MPRRIQLAQAFLPLITERAPYKVYPGGRGAGKSWAFATALIAKAAQDKLLILCAREYQNSIGDSVHRLLANRIHDMGLSSKFTITDRSIRSDIGSEFIFKGLRRNANEIKSTEGIDICWVAQGEAVSEASWQALDPTIRKPGSEIWIDYNPDGLKDPTHVLYNTNAPPGAIVKHVTFRDNPWFTPELEAKRLRELAADIDDYNWIYEGMCRGIKGAVIFASRVAYEAFETPDDVRFFYGVDWGFANDPSVIIRCFIKDDKLYIDHEQFGWQVELDELGEKIFDKVPGSKLWPLRADNSRPETISYMSRQGYRISAAEKWPGSVEDGIAFLKSFSRIVIHDRCTNMADEAKRYSYKVDPKTRDVLPVVADKHNHGWDAVRYALDGHIQAALVPTTAKIMVGGELESARMGL